MNTAFLVFLLLTTTTLVAFSQTTISLQKELSENLVLLEFEFLNGNKLSKQSGATWKLSNLNKQLKIVEPKENTLIVEANFLNGDSYYSIDNQTWHQKSTVVNNSLELYNIANLKARFEEENFSLYIEWEAKYEGKSNFYLIPCSGGNRILITTLPEHQGINNILIGVKDIKKGNYYLIKDDTHCTSISTIIIF